VAKEGEKFKRYDKRAVGKRSQEQEEDTLTGAYR
jgi:hypothetical protein